MVVKLTQLAAFLICLSCARAELLLVPEVTEQDLDGAKIRLLAFADDGKKVTYQPPLGWDYSGNATQLTLSPHDKVQANATVRKIPLQQPGAFGAEDIKKLVEAAPTFVPGGSERVSVVAQESNPLLINRKETFELVLDYVYYGQEFRSSILFLNRGNEQMRFQLTCRASDFPELQRTFQQSLYSWHDL